MKGSLSGRVGYSLWSSKNRLLLVGLFVQNMGQCRSIDLSNKVTEGLAYTTKCLPNEQWGKSSHRVFINHPELKNSTIFSLWALHFSTQKSLCYKFKHVLDVQEMQAYIWLVQITTKQFYCFVRAVIIQQNCHVSKPILWLMIFNLKIIWKCFIELLSMSRVRKRIAFISILLLFFQLCLSLA